MIHEFINPVPCKTKVGDGYVWYVRDGGIWENDIFCIVLSDGQVRHFRSDQFTIENNGTFDIKNEKESSKET